MQITGIIASRGISIGKAYLFNKDINNFIIDDRIISKNETEDEIKKVQLAINKYQKELSKTETLNKIQKEIIFTHIEMLKDPFLKDTVERYIEFDLFNSEKAFARTMDDMIAMLESLDDEYLRSRAADYYDIKEQVLFKIKGIIPKTLNTLPKNSIVVAKELTPSDTSSMDISNINGFAIDTGGKTDHTSIIAETLGIPAVVGLKNAFEIIEDGDLIILDANTNKIYLNPDEELLNQYKKELEYINIEEKRFNKLKNKPAKTLDGHKVEVVANIGSFDDLEVGLDFGAEGVGLFRTELLYMNNIDFPSEDKQFEIYKEVAERLKNKPLIIRTLDIGGDKSLPYFDFPKEDNPFLGLRALRFSFDMTDVFKDQLRAILRASHYGNIKILLPMVISVEEIIKVKDMLSKLMIELDEKSIDYDKNIEIGIMIETPASAIMADQLIKHVDYFSIGTNDLTQYVLSADRGNDRVADIYSNYHPAVLRLIKRVIDISHKEGKWTGMCGGFASDTKATKLLLGLGLDEFSATAANIPKIKDIIRNTYLEDAKKYADKVLSFGNVTDLKEFINKYK